MLLGSTLLLSIGLFFQSFPIASATTIHNYEHPYLAVFGATNSQVMSVRSVINCILPWSERSHRNQRSVLGELLTKSKISSSITSAFLRSSRLRFSGSECLIRPSRHLLEGGITLQVPLGSSLLEVCCLPQHQFCLR
jgi:hypothetical protein